MRALALNLWNYRGLTTIGGADSMLADMLQHLQASGWDCSALVLSQQRDSGTDGNVPIARIKCSDDRSMDEAVEQTDVIITQLGGTQFAKKLGRRHSKPVVQVIHNTSQITRVMVMTGGALMVYNSEWIRAAHGNNGRNILCRPPALEKPIYGGNAAGKITLINLVANKGPDVFYTLAEANPDLDFLAIKGGYEVDRQIVKHLPNVEVREFGSDLNEIYRDSSFVLIPSIYESYSRTAVEAMARGIPVIASNTLGLRECISDGGTIVEDRTDIKAWQAALDMDLYEHRSVMASWRYRELHTQTKHDLTEFEQTLREVVHGTG